MLSAPWLDAIARSEADDRPTALYLGPLNALIDDQFRSLCAFGTKVAEKPAPGSAEALGFLAPICLMPGVTVVAAQYHGGVRPSGNDPDKRDQNRLRREIRRPQPDVVFTNPEMHKRGRDRMVLPDDAVELRMGAQRPRLRLAEPRKIHEHDGPAATRGCRFVPIAKVYGFPEPVPCGHCDRCDPSLAF